MSILNTPEIQKIQNRDTIFICGDDEKLKFETLYEILILEVKHFYFINPDESLLKFLSKKLDIETFSGIESFNEIDDLETCNVIACGIKPLSRSFFDKFKHFKNDMLIFFNEIGNFITTWQKKIQSITIVEKTIEKFVEEHTKRPLAIEPEIKKGEDDYFINRGNEIDLHTKHFPRRKVKAFKIVGMAGIGKRAYINNLKRNFGLNTNNFVFYFQDKSDGLAEILSDLSPKLGISFDEKLHRGLKVNAKVKGILKELFNTFDKLKNARIIYYNLEEIYDFNREKFYKKNIEEFFHLLLNRTSYSGNKIYLLSNREFNFERSDEGYIQTIKLNALKPFHIKLIAAQGFSEKNRHDLAQIIRDYENEDKIDNLIGGHPYIAQLFVGASEEVGMMNILNDTEFEKYFEEEYKVKYLMEKIPLNEKEQKLLGYLSLFKGNIELDFLSSLTENIPEVIAQLKKSFLIEMVHLKNGEARYYIPTLIQNYICNQLSEETLSGNHSEIGEYYWKVADSFDTPKLKVLEAYRLAFHHYNKSYSAEKKQYFLLRYKNKLLDQAREFFANRYFFYAWEYYNELYVEQHTDLAPEDLAAYLESETILKKKGENTEHKFDIAFSEHKDDKGLLTTYAKFLFYQRRYDEAKNLCEYLIDEFPSKNHKVNNLYPNVLYNLDKIEESIQKITRWINSLENMQKTAAVKMQLYTNYILYSNILISNLSITSLIRQVLLSVGICDSSNMNYIDILDERTRHTDEIIYHFNKLIDEARNKNSLKLFVEFLKRKRHSSKIDILQNKYQNSLNYNYDIEEDDIFSQKEDLEISSLVTRIKFMIHRNIYFDTETNLIENTDQNSAINDFKNSMCKSIAILEKALSVGIKNLAKARYLYINRLSLLEYVTNLEILYKKCSAKPQNDKHILFVEGKTDKKILKRAMHIFNAESEFMTIKVCGGANIVYNEVISWVYSSEKNEGKAIVVLDNDESGLYTKSELHKNKKFSIEHTNKNILIISLNRPTHILNFYKKEIFKTRQPKGKPKKEYEYSIEHMFPIDCWQYAKKRNWLEEISDSRTISGLVNLDLDQSLKEYFISKGISEEELIYITHKIKDNSKEDFAEYTCNQNIEYSKIIFKEFIPTIEEMDQFLL